MEYTRKASRGKDVRLEVTGDGQLVVHAPKSISQKDIDTLIKKHQDWIETHQKLVLERQEALRSVPKLNQGALEKLKEDAREDYTARCDHWAKIMGLRYNRIHVKFQHSRWGSCSSLGNINLNALLMLAPESVRDYVIVHELAHLKHMNHSKAFWQEVENTLPAYKNEKTWLKENGPKLMGCIE